LNTGGGSSDVSSFFGFSKQIFNFNYQLYRKTYIAQARQLSLKFY